MEMADRIKSRRLALGYTQEELAEKVGLQKSAIAKYENGRVENMKRSMIEKMSQVLECSPAYLMGWAGAISDELKKTADRTLLYIQVLESYGYKITLREASVDIFEKKSNTNFTVPRKTFMSMIQRCHQDITWNLEKFLSEISTTEEDPLIDAAHERTDIKVTDEMKKYDDDIMDDENF